MDRPVQGAGGRPCYNQKKRDNLFLLEDGTYLIVDYENIYKKIKKIVIYTGDVKSADPTLMTDCFTLRAEQAFLSHIDGEAAFLSIQGKLHSGIPLSDDDRMKLIILPLTVPGSEGENKRCWRRL